LKFVTSGCGDGGVTAMTLTHVAFACAIALCGRRRVGVTARGHSVRRLGVQGAASEQHT
jgi:hypothetical protein